MYIMGNEIDFLSEDYSFLLEGKGREDIQNTYKWCVDSLDNYIESINALENVYISKSIMDMDKKLLMLDRRSNTKR